jgi:hypothetical protein
VVNASPSAEFSVLSDGQVMLTDGAVGGAVGTAVGAAVAGAPLDEVGGGAVPELPHAASAIAAMVITRMGKA